MYKIDEANKSRKLYVILRCIRKAITIRFHDLSSHFGIERTVNRIREFYYFSNMKRYVKQHIGSCLECLLAKKKVGRQAGEIHPISPGSRPFEIVHLGPFVKSSRGNKYVFVAICNLTKFAQIYPVTNVKANTTIKISEEFINKLVLQKDLLQVGVQLLNLINFKSSLNFTYSNFK